MVEENFENFAYEMLHIGINLPIQFFIMVENFLRIVFVKRFILASIRIFSHSLWLKQVLKINYVYETLHIGINLPIQSFTKVGENYENCVS